MTVGLVSFAGGGGWKDFVIDFGAPTDGVSDSTPASMLWQAYAAANDGAKLYMPPHHYVLDLAGQQLGLGSNNVTISGYGASVSRLIIGNNGLLREDYNHSARFQTTNLGATSLTLVKGAEISRFSVWQWILVAGLSLQDFGYPPNFQYNEYRQISGIVGATISFAEPLNFAYLSTWPEADPTHAAGVDLGGPATVYAMAAPFAGTKQYLGLRVTQLDQPSTNVGENTLLLDMKFDGVGPASSMGKSIVIKNTAIGTANEVDKAVEYVEYNNVTGGSILLQSASITQLVLKNSTVTQLNGTTQNTTIENSTVGEVVTGPTGYGHGISLTALNSTLGTTRYAARNEIDPSMVSFRGGTFSVPLASRNVLISTAVPGQKYFFAYYDGSVHDRADGTGLVTSFTITALRQDATSVYADTDLGVTMPTPTFGGNSANRYLAYAAATITQTNSGPADLTQWVAPAGAKIDLGQIVG